MSATNILAMKTEKDPLPYCKTGGKAEGVCRPHSFPCKWAVQ